LPRLAVLSVLSAASSPCPDLNLIHYKNGVSVREGQFLLSFDWVSAGSL